MRTRLLWSVVPLLFSLAPAEAAMVIVRVSGVLNDVSNVNGSLPVQAEAGDRYALDYSVDSAIVPVAGEEAAYYYDAITRVSWQVNGQTVSYDHPAGFAQALVIDDAEDGEQFVDSVTFSIRTAESYPAMLIGTTFESVGGSPSDSPLSSTDLPLDPMILMLFESRYSWLLSLADVADSGDYLVGNVDSISVVPLPATGFLLASGLSLLGMGIRPRCRQVRRPVELANSR